MLNYSFILPSDWNEGTGLSFYLHYFVNDSILSGILDSNFAIANIDTYYTTSKFQTFIPRITNPLDYKKHKIEYIGNLNMTGMKIFSQILCSLVQAVEPSLATYIYTPTIEIVYESTDFGSQNKTTK